MRDVFSQIIVSCPKKEVPWLILNCPHIVTFQNQVTFECVNCLLSRLDISKATMSVKDV